MLSAIFRTIFITHLKRAACKSHIVFILLTLKICAIYINLWGYILIKIKHFSIFTSNEAFNSQICSLFSQLLNTVIYLSFFNIIFQFLEFIKKLPVHKLQELCKKLAYPIILVGGTEDFNEAQEIASVDPMRIYNACGKFKLQESADLVRKSKLVISHDTGLQYIACAFNKPVLAIWGGTSPLLDVEPYYGVGNNNRYRNFLVNGLPCQPCSNFGTKACPKKHFKCMEEQNIDAIVEAAKSYYHT